MVKALDRHPVARRPYRRLFDRAARADEPGIHDRRGARVSLGRRERDGGDRNVRLEAPIKAGDDGQRQEPDRDLWRGFPLGGGRPGAVDNVNSDVSAVTCL
jgi:hypothetical protein